MKEGGIRRSIAKRNEEKRKARWKRKDNEWRKENYVNI